MIGKMRHEKKKRWTQSILDEYTNAKKWINTCVCCGKSGYNPKLPEVLTMRWYGHDDHPTYIAEKIRYLYSPMAVDELGRCKECRNAMENNKTEKEKDQ